ncbi:MAG TPA: 16S rRNA (guanine(966)-N(2))-methyltransferase RsmD [Vicinamibacterales bacterium]|nr:16S rRNA (guanine(966)-N(2))-methyltransferase RsmD [Vicinamibacterales bacterium]
MRVVAGRYRGRLLKSPAWDGLRPTSDRLRETLFNILGPSLPGARVLDGYAGTGAIGIEALSRGAASVTFVERDPRAVKLIAANLEALGIGAAGKPVIIRAGLADAVTRLDGQVFDLIILDPPYAHGAAREALDGAAALAAAHTRVVVEHAARHAPPDAHAGLRRTRTVTAGDSALSFYER